MKRAPIVIVALAAASASASGADRAGPAGPASSHRTVAGLVTDLAGAPLRAVVIFAADAATDKVVVVTVSDDGGQVSFVLPARRHNFGVISTRLGVQRLVPRGRDGFVLLLRPLAAVGPAAPSSSPGLDLVVAAVRAQVVRGQVSDQTGVGLDGVRIDAVRESGALAATAISEAGGRFTLAVPGGSFRLRPWAPGMQPTEITREAGRVVVIMAITAALQQVEVTTGHVLRFRAQDSIDPEYFPPAPVRAWLLFAYGICANSGPLRAADKRELKKYWYLDVLRQTPPNPATISTTSCTPATLYDLPPRSLTDGFGDLPGF